MLYFANLFSIWVKMSLQLPDEGQRSEPTAAESNDTHQSLLLGVNDSDQSSTNYGMLPQSQAGGRPNEYYYHPPYAYYGMSSHSQLQPPPPPPPPPPPHPDYWYSHPSVADSSWKLQSSPFVTKEVESERKDCLNDSKSDLEQSLDSQEQIVSSSDVSPRHIPTNNSYDNPGPQIMAPSPSQNTAIDTSPYYGHHPPFYGLPPPPDHAPFPHYPYQWHRPLHPYHTCPPGYQAGVYPSYSIPHYVNQPHVQSSAAPGKMQFVVPRNTRKRTLPTSHNRKVPHRQQSHPTTSRKRKMYSDYVGVTYNLTHAKYQACITHYRKQHYLGRYKLSVDAALAYDESAKVLKGANWKVNFPTREAYEKAREEEKRQIGKIRDKDVDIDESKAAEAVASKIAQLVAGLERQSKGNVDKTADATSLTSKGHISRAFDNSKDIRGEVVRFGQTLGGKNMRLSGDKITPFAALQAAGNDTEGVLKVTPSHLEQDDSPAQSSEIDSKLRPDQSEANEDNGYDEETIHNAPYFCASNPTRHDQRVEISTPESAIKPKKLKYQEDVVKTIATATADSSGQNSAPMITNPMLDKRSAQSDASTTSTGSTPPTSKSGKLAAASALMTLHKKEEK